MKSLLSHALAQLNGLDLHGIAYNMRLEYPGWQSWHAHMRPRLGTDTAESLTRIQSVRGLERCDCRLIGLLSIPCENLMQHIAVSTAVNSRTFTKGEAQSFEVIATVARSFAHTLKQMQIELKWGFLRRYDGSNPAKSYKTLHKCMPSRYNGL